MALPIRQQIFTWLQSLPFVAALRKIEADWAAAFTIDWSTAAQITLDGLNQQPTPSNLLLIQILQALTGKTPKPGPRNIVEDYQAFIKDPHLYIQNAIIAFSQDPNLLGLKGALGSIIPNLVLQPLADAATSAEENPYVFIAEAQGRIASLLVGAHVIGVTAEAAGLGQIKTVTELVKQIFEGYGLAELGAESMRPIFEIALGEAGRRFWNRQLRPTRLGISELIELFIRGEIGVGVFRDTAQMWGYREGDIDLLQKLARVRLAPADIIQLYHFRSFTAEQAAQELVFRGYTFEDAQHLIELEDKGLIEQQYTEILRIARKGYQDSILDKDQFSAILRGARRSESGIALEVAVGDMSKADSKRNLNVSQIEQLFKADMLAEPEVRYWLKVHQLSDFAIDELLKLWKDVKAPKPKDLNANEISGAYVEGIIERDAAVALLKQVGWRGADINVILDTALKRRGPRPKEIAESAVISAHRKGMLTDDQAISRLVTLGYHADDAAALLRWSVIQPKPPKRELDVAQIAKLVKLEVKNDAWAIDRFVALGYDHADAELLLQAETETVKKAGAKGKQLTEAQITKGVKNGTLTPQQGFDALVKIGLSPADAIIYLQLEGIDTTGVTGSGLVIIPPVEVAKHLPPGQGV